jgi:transcriptional regulator with XRE-family HTH domain
LDCDKIRKLREKLGLSQEDAAVAAGMRNRQFWSNLETGRRTNVKIDTLERVAKVLHVRPGELLKQ